MAINTEITKIYNDNSVQVAVKTGNSPQRYYKVPAQEADSFQADYKKGSNKMMWTTTALTLLGGFVGMIPAYLLSGKLVANNALRFIINIGTGFVGCLAGSAIGDKLGLKNYKKMLAQHGAEEIDPPKSGLPI